MDAADTAGSDREVVIGVSMLMDGFHVTCDMEVKGQGHKITIGHRHATR